MPQQISQASGAVQLGPVMFLSRFFAAFDARQAFFEKLLPIRVERKAGQAGARKS
jgi:hypothetical protein